MSEPQSDKNPQNILAGFRSLLPGATAIFLLALVLRILHVLAIRHTLFFSHPIQDELTYDLFARSAAGHGDWIGQGLFYQAPLYQYFLAVLYKIFGQSYLVPRLVQAVIDSCSAAGIFWIGGRFFSRRVGWIAGIGAALYSQFIYNCGALLPTTITLFLDVALLGTLFLLSERWKQRPDPGRPFARQLWPWLIPGALFGLQALAATNILALTPIFWAWFAWGIFETAKPRPAAERTAETKKKRRGPPAPSPAPNTAVAPLAARLAAALCFSLGAGIAIAPATIHNYLVGKEFILISYNAGINFYIGNSGDYEKKVLSRVGSDWDAIKAVGERATTYKEASQKFMAASEAYMAEHPLQYLGLLIHKGYLLIHGNEIYRNQAIYPDRLVSPVLGALLWKVGVPGGPGLAFPWGILFPACIPGLYLAFRNRERKGIFLAAFWVIYGCTIVAFFVTERYRIPMVPPMLLIAAAGWSRLHEWWNRGKTRYALLGTMAATGLLVNWNPGPMARDINHDAYLSVAERFYSQGDTAAAGRCYRKGWELDTNDANAWYLLAWRIYEPAGKLDSAAAYFQKANELLPRGKDILLGLARMAARTERYADARNYLEQAKAASPFEVGNVFEPLGSTALQAQDFLTANRYFTAALFDDPRSSPALLGQAITVFALHGLQPALPCFDRLFSLYPRSADGYFNLAIIFARSGHPGNAVDAAMKAMSIDPTISAAQFLSEQAALCGRQQEVNAFLRR